MHLCTRIPRAVLRSEWDHAAAPDRPVFQCKLTRETDDQVGRSPDRPSIQFVLPQAFCMEALTEYKGLRPPTPSVQEIIFD